MIAPGEPDPSRQRERPLILIVEDQSELRRLYAEQLTISGFDVIEAANGAEAVRWTSAHLPDVVLMDLSLPVLDGWEATRRIKAAAQTKHIPVIALTANAMTGDREKAIAAGCDDFDIKPVELRGLMVKIQALLPEEKC